MLLAMSAGLQGCSDAAGPRHPLIGRYEVTTNLETFTRPIGPCDGALYCYEQLPADGATLVGMLEIADTISASASLQRHDPYQGQDGPITLSGDFWVVDPVMVELGEPGSTTYVSLRYGELAGDSIVGDVTWQVNGRHYYYNGTFVARRIAPR